jgi:hypothetical protein
MRSVHVHALTQAALVSLPLCWLLLHTQTRRLSTLDVPLQRAVSDGDLQNNGLQGYTSDGAVLSSEVSSAAATPGRSTIDDATSTTSNANAVDSPTTGDAAALFGRVSSESWAQSKAGQARRSL